MREIPPSEEEREQSCEEAMTNTSEENTLQVIDRHDIIVSDRLTHRKSHTNRYAQENNLPNRVRLHDAKCDIEHHKFYNLLWETMSYEIAKTGDTVHARILEKRTDKHRHPIPDIMPRYGKREHPCIDSRRGTGDAHEEAHGKCRSTPEEESDDIVYPWHPS